MIYITFIIIPYIVPNMIPYVIQLPSADPPPCPTQSQNQPQNVMKNKTERPPIFENTPRSSYTPLRFHSLVGCTLHTKSTQI